MGWELLWNPFAWMWVASPVMIGVGWRRLRQAGGERASRRLATAAVGVGGAFLFFMSLPIIAYTLLAVFG